jgi:hypothetical protein
MKKFITIFAMLLISLTVFAQSQIERKTLLKSKNGYEIIERSESGQVLKYFYFGYQNKKYTHVTDIGSIMIVGKDKLEIFANKLIELSGLEKETEISYTEKNYTISKYKGYSMLFVSDKNGKYTTLSFENSKKFGTEILENSHLLE